MKNVVRHNLLKIQKEIAPLKPNIIAVTKYFAPAAGVCGAGLQKQDGQANAFAHKDVVIAAYEAGLRDFGESRVLEATEKINALPDEIRKNSCFHLIGHLQTNKVKKAVAAFDFIHSVDTLKLAEVISDEALKTGKVQKVLLQLNNAGEEQKFGFSKEELTEQFGKIIALKGIEIAGLMNMAPVAAIDKELEILFDDVVQTKKRIEIKYGIVLKELSMGMSQDYKTAARAGATMLRIGRKLFN